MNCTKTYVIAEAGVNHNGDFELAKRMVEEAANAGASCVKFQMFKPENLVSRHAQKAEYQKRNTDGNENQLDMLKKLTLFSEDYVALAQCAKIKKIDFCTTPFDAESVRVVHELRTGFWKIPSGEITNLPYLLQIAQYNEPIIMSTGMSSMCEIQQAIEAIRRYNSKELVLLHCNTEYPTPFSDVNLKAMLELQHEFKCHVGYSDHTAGIEIPVAAVALGAKVIEKHFTLDRNMEGPDHKASLEPSELRSLISAIRNVEQALGDGKKRPQESEMKNMAIARKSIIAKKTIQKGEFLSEENLTTKRPGNGISPMKWYEVMGTRAIRTFEEDELIEIEKN